MSPARLLLAGTCAGYLLAQAEPYVGSFLFTVLSLSAALGAVVATRAIP
ncbi:hypothetical protein JYJ95_38125 [Corallococcus exiguus]|nr:hypothetical protein [Corallococcus exiguus]MBN8472356.1 hypothetical protein [Corallococcus exiguus]